MPRTSHTGIEVYGNFEWARGISTINATPGTATTVVDEVGYTAVR